MIKLNILMVVIAVSIVVTGCAKNGSVNNKVYQPNTLSDEQINQFHKLAKEVSENDPFYSIVFIEEKSLLSITRKAQPGKRFIRGVVNNKYREAICMSEDPFFRMVRATGVGLQYKLIDPKTVHKFGPWNVDICW